MWWWALAAAMAGYGDASDGHPSLDERELHVWTNAVRVEPEAFSEFYQRGGCRFRDFEASEKTPKWPMALSRSLNAVARGHSEDMREHGTLSHTSSDGTSFGERVEAAYGGGAIGENVASGAYSSTFEVVAEGWMCSSGHRANIMAEGWEEFGAGVAGTYFTQNFGARGAQGRAMNMGAHRPADPSGGDVTFLVDAVGAEKAEQVRVLVNGVATEMELVFGTRRSGVYEAKVPYAEGCQAYWFEAEVDGATARFPEDGAYAYGDCKYDDEAAGWLSAKTLGGKNSPLPLDEQTEDDGRGCQQAPGGPFAAAALALLTLRRRRSRG